MEAQQQGRLDSCQLVVSVHGVLLATVASGLVFGLPT